MAQRILRRGNETGVSAVLWNQGPAKPAPPLALAVRGAAASPSADQVSSEQLEQAAREARAQGYAEGQAAGRAQASEELKPVLDRLAQSLAAMAALAPRIRKDAEGDLVKLSLAIARRVLHRELTLDPESIKGVVKVALEKLHAREICRVRMHPQQESIIREMLNRMGAPPSTELVPDGALQLGDVVFETPHGALDASIESQLKEIERGLVDRLRR